MSETSVFNKPFWKFFSRIGDLALINTLWVICSLPIFTIGASTTAMYSVILKIIKKEEGPIIQSFLNSFKQNFKQATFLWLLAVFIGTDFALIIRYFYVQGNLWNNQFMMLVPLALFIYLTTMLYLFPTLSIFENSIKQSIINSFALAMRHLPSSFLFLITTIVILFSIYIFPPFFLIGFALIAFLNGQILVRIFDKYI